MNKVLIIGATSAIAEATARLFAAEAARLFLVARNGERLQTVAADLQVRGAAQVDSAVADLNEVDGHEALLDRAWVALGGVDMVLIAYGTLPDQKACEGSFSRTLEALNSNCISTLSLLTGLANRLEAQGRGTVAVISSVAGDRGRQSNYVYGTAKAALSTFLSGLRNRLYASGVRVVTVKPGFVDTPMTRAFPKGPLWASAQQVARHIHRAMHKGTPVVYAPPFWRLIMAVIGAIPEGLFRRLRL